MSQLSSYQTSLFSKQNELSRVQQEKANQQAKSAELERKIISAQDAMRRTKSQSLLNSKAREIEALNRQIVSISKNMANIEKKLASINKQVFDYQQKISKEQSNLDKKRLSESQHETRRQQQSFRAIEDSLFRHDQLHRQAFHNIEALRQVPDKIIVLFLAANPIDQGQLRLDEEARAITEMIRKSKHRDVVKLESCWALQTIDLIQALNEYNPAIVHFSGHGSSDDEIVFQTPQGTSKFISKEALVQTMMASSEGIRLVFLNACHSNSQAQAIANFVDATIGMNTAIGDNAARIFSSQFYSTIRFGLSVQTAFEQAKALLMLEGIPEESTPELFVKPGLDARDLILVNPPKM